LNKNIKIVVQPDIPLGEAIDAGSKGGLMAFRPIGKLDMGKVTVPPADLPLGAWLQAFEDSAEVRRLVVRDYGILITTESHIPQTAMTVQEF
jgi:hypothetical protein